MIDINIIIKSIRPQFVWDKKNHNGWLLTDFSRDEFFCKELAILVFINACEKLSVENRHIKNAMQMDEVLYEYFLEKLYHIKVAVPGTAYSVELKRALNRKTGLVLNLVKFHSLNLS